MTLVWPVRALNFPGKNYLFREQHLIQWVTTRQSRTCVGAAKRAVPSLLCWCLGECGPGTLNLSLATMWRAENEAITEHKGAELRDEDRPGPKGSLSDPWSQLCLKETRSSPRSVRHVREYIPFLLKPVWIRTSVTSNKKHLNWHSPLFCLTYCLASDYLRRQPVGAHMGLLDELTNQSINVSESRKPKTYIY